MGTRFVIIDVKRWGICLQDQARFEWFIKAVTVSSKYTCVEQIDDRPVCRRSQIRGRHVMMAMES